MICHRQRSSHNYYIFVLSPIRQKVTVTCIQGRQTIIDGFTRAFAPLFFIIIQSEKRKRFVDLWAGCHVFRQAWIMQSSILWSWWEERECARGQERLRHKDYVFLKVKCVIFSMLKILLHFIVTSWRVWTLALSTLLFWVIWHRLNNVTKNSRK